MVYISDGKIINYFDLSLHLVVVGFLISCYYLAAKFKPHKKI